MNKQRFWGLLACVLSTMLLTVYFAACGSNSPTLSANACRVGHVLGPGESCEADEVGTFQVRQDGSACIGDLCSEAPTPNTSKSEISRTNNDKSFSASLIPGTLTWRIVTTP